MKSKYKVKYNGFVYHVLSKDERKFICECDTKHMAYKIKSALEMVGVVQQCWDCVNGHPGIVSPCDKCKYLTKAFTNFQPREKK